MGKTLHRKDALLLMENIYYLHLIPVTAQLQGKTNAKQGL